MKTIFSVLMLLFISTSSMAQELGERLKNTRVTIFNLTDNALTVLLGTDSNHLKPVRIPKRVHYSTTSFTTDPFVRIKTKNKSVFYQLRLGTAYILFWNDDRKLWDLRKN